MSSEEKEFCTAHSEKLDHMLEAQAKQGTDIEWLVKIGARVMVIAGTALMLAVTAGVPMVWGVYRDHTEMKTRMDAMVQTDSNVQIWRDHIAERATLDHRECHEAKGGRR